MSAKYVGVAAAVASLVLAGCGSSSTTTTVTSTASATETGSATASTGATTTAPTVTKSAADQRIAQDAQLRLSDFPSGWVASDQQDKSKSECVVPKAKAATTAHDASGDFNTNNDNTEARSAVYIYADAATAKQWFTELSSQSARECYANAITNAGAQQSGGLKFGNITTGSLSIAPVGDERAASRLTIPVSQNGTDVNVTADLEFVRVDRGLAILELLDTLTPFDQDLGAKLVKNVTDRLTAGLNQSS